MADSAAAAFHSSAAWANPLAIVFAGASESGASSEMVASLACFLSLRWGDWGGESELLWESEERALDTAESLSESMPSDLAPAAVAPATRLAPADRGCCVDGFEDEAVPFSWENRLLLLLGELLTFEGELVLAGDDDDVRLDPCLVADETGFEDEDDDDLEDVLSSAEL